MNPYFINNHERSFGTFPLTGDALRQSVLAATKVGYRAFDTAQMYGNEADTGRALQATSIARQEFCITTKVHPDNFTPEKFIASVEQSLKALQTDYVDVLLLHWPPIGGEITVSLQLLEEVANKGMARSIGVSNYNCAMLRQAIKIVAIPLVTNQVEFHPLLNQDKLLSGAAETGIPLSSYCSVARGAVFSHAEFAEIGKTYNKTAAQIVLRWILQKGVSINTMSTKVSNMQNNFDVMDFTLSSVDMAKIDALTATNYRIVTREIAPWAPDWD